MAPLGSQAEGMTDRIRHRGPDAEGHFMQDGFGLGHRRLSIIDLSEHSNQPFTSADGRYVMIYNGEVYNYKEVGAELGIQTKTTSDTEVIIEAFAKEGPKMVSRLNGMFTAAILDKNEKKLFLFRDRLGIKPHTILKLAANRSSVRNQVCSPTIKEPTIDDEAVAKFLHMAIPEPQSIITQIKKFPSGNYAELNGGKLDFHSYLNPSEKVSTDVLTNQKSATDQPKPLA